MATGRTIQKYLRAYQNGYDLSGDVTAVGELAVAYDHEALSALGWEVAGGLLGQATITTGTLNALLDVQTAPTASPHDLLAGWNGQTVDLMLPVGIRAEPAMGDPVWMVSQRQKSAIVTPPASGLVTGSVEYAPARESAGEVVNPYEQPWGTLIHAKAARTGANSATGHDGGAASAAGGWIMVQAFAAAGSGNVVIKLQDAAVNSNGSFADVAGLSVTFLHSEIPGSRVAVAAASAAIRQFTRWQIVLTGITSVTFALSLVRGR